MNWIQKGWKAFTGAISDGYNWLKDQWSDLTGASTNERNVNATNQANKDIARDTNAMNYDVAMQNLDFQKQVQEYNKALQEQIFEREDTAYQRTAQDMINAGLNPLSMQGTNGAGEAIAMQPLNNQFQAQQPAPMQAYQMPNQFSEFINAAQSVLSGVLSIKDLGIKRDSITLEKDKHQFDKILSEINNFNQTHDKGYYFDKSGKMIITDEDLYDSYIKRIKNENENISRNIEHDTKTGRYNSDTNFEKTITAISDWLTSGRSQEHWNKLKKQFPILELLDDYAKLLMPEYSSEPETIINHGGKQYKVLPNGDWEEIKK